MVENVWRIRGVREKFWCARMAVTKVAFFGLLGHGRGVRGGLAPPASLQTLEDYRGGYKTTSGARAALGKNVGGHERPLRMPIFIECLGGHHTFECMGERIHTIFSVDCRG